MTTLCSSELKRWGARFFETDILPGRVTSILLGLPEVSMRRLIAGIILIGFSWVVIFGQQPDKPGSALSTPVPNRLLISDKLPAVPSLAPSTQRYPFGQHQLDLFKSPSAQSQIQDGPFVFQNGALYMRVGQLLMPVSGGGASGCFSLDLPQRINNLREFIPRLDYPERSRPAPPKPDAIF